MPASHFHTLDEKLHGNEKSWGETALKRGGAWRRTADVGLGDLPQHLEPPALTQPSWAQLVGWAPLRWQDRRIRFCQILCLQTRKESEKKLKESETENWGRRDHKAGCQLRGIWRHFYKLTIFWNHTFFFTSGRNFLGCVPSSWVASMLFLVSPELQFKMGCLINNLRL